MRLPVLPRVPTVSVIITAYNVERFIGRAVDSALAVDWPAAQREIIVVNDGSTDRTPEILAGYGEKIRVISQPNAGCMAAMTVGLQAATGEVLAFLDGDDEWPVDKLRRQIRVLRKNPRVGLVYGDMEIIDSDGNQLEASFLKFAGHTPRRGRILGHLLPDNFAITGSIVVRSALKHLFCPLPAYAAAYDWYVVSRAAEVSEIEFVSTSVNRYRFHGSNMYLGQEGEKAYENQLRDVIFTHKMLTSYDLSDVTTAEMVRGLAVANTKLSGIVQFRQMSVDQLLPIDDDARAQAGLQLHKSWQAVRDGDLNTAMRSAVRAVAYDACNNEAVLLFDGLFNRVMRESGVMAAELPEDTRTAAVQADADELLRSPELLRAWAMEFSEADDVTLVAIAHPDRYDELAHALVQVAPIVGLVSANAPDVVLHACADPGMLRYMFAAAYGRTAGVAGMKRYDETRIQELHRALAIPLALAG